VNVHYYSTSWDGCQDPEALKSVGLLEGEILDTCPADELGTDNEASAYRLELMPVTGESRMPGPGDYSLNGNPSLLMYAG
jgi:hypothetical protein